jgi:two-component system OmpR family sensor kinase
MPASRSWRAVPRRGRLPGWRGRRPSRQQRPGLRGRRAQLRIRVVAGVMAVMLVTLAAFDFAAVTAFRGYLFGQTDARLSKVLAQYRGPRLANALQVAKAVRGRPPVFFPPPFPGLLGTYYVGFLTADHRVINLYAINRGLVPQVPPGQAARVSWASPRTVKASFGPGKVRVQAVRADAGTLLASTSLDGVNSTVGQLVLILTVGSLAAMVLVAGGIGLVMRRGLRPIEAMAADADRITAGDLTDRVTPDHPASEVGRLGAALNGMLARIEAAVREREASQEANRRFFADASHELRNPLASLRANAELYQQGALSTRAEVDEAMRRIALEARRMGGLVDDMLRLARLDQQPGQQRAAVDVTALADGCAERAEAAGPQWTWKRDIEPGLVITGDEELLRRAVDNLLANVRAHTPAGTVAVISAARRGGGITIEVSDNGPGVPAADLPRIFDRFYRGTAQPARNGCGLGLAIAAATAAAHEGKATAALSHPHGLRVTLTLPTGAGAVS